MTQQVTDTLFLELLDLAPPCMNSYHGAVGDGPAVWIVWHRSPFRPCGCTRTSYPGAWCDNCLQRHQKRSTNPAVIYYCPDCTETWPARLSVLKKWEPINARQA